MESILTVNRLRKSYGNFIAVDNLSFEVKKGEIFGLLGHNGAGKSTSIECILGVKASDGGDIKILGMNSVKDRKKLFEKVGVQFQESNYQTKIKVDEICKVTSSLYKNPVDWRELIGTFGLSGKGKSPVYDLSGGERQRLSVLLALIPKPELVFLDELTTGLDAKARRDIWKYLKMLKDNGLTIVLTSHYMDEVEALCDRIHILKKGKTVAEGSVSDVISGASCNNLEDAYLYYSGEEIENESI